MNPNAALFILDCHDPSISTDEIRERYRRGEYGKLQSKHMKGWLAIANRKADTAA